MILSAFRAKIRQNAEVYNLFNSKNVVYDEVIYQKDQDKL